jgi:hypothetical protein
MVFARAVSCGLDAYWEIEHRMSKNGRLVKTTRFSFRRVTWDSLHQARHPDGLQVQGHTSGG